NRLARLEAHPRRRAAADVADSRGAGEGRTQRFSGVRSPPLPPPSLGPSPVGTSRVGGIRQTFQRRRRLIDFAKRALRNIARDSRDQSGLMPANLITLPHFSTSLAMRLPKSAGEPPSVVPPRSASCALILGSASAALISLLSFSI